MKRRVASAWWHVVKGRGRTAGDGAQHGHALLATMLGSVMVCGCSPAMLVNVLTPTAGYAVHIDLAYGDDERQRLDVYVPDELRGAAPVVVFFYGGRWQRGDKEDYLFVGQALASRGLVAVVADYRRYPQVRFPAFVEDGARAVAWTRTNITAYGGDAQAMFLVGHSAGAHIAAMLALDERYLEAVGGSADWLRGMIGLAGPYDFLPLQDEILKDLFGPPDRYGASQPVRFVDGGEPPMLLLHGLDDQTVLVRNTQRLAQRVSSRGGRARTILYPELDHVRIVGALSVPLRGIAPVLDDMVSFIRDTLESPGGNLTVTVSSKLTAVVEEEAQRK